MRDRAEVLHLGPARVRWTDAVDGPVGHHPPRRAHDDHCCGPDAVQRRSGVRVGEWFHLTQVHGPGVVIAEESTPGAEADAVVTAQADLTLAIATADCASVAFASDAGVIGAAHGGWRGLDQGIIPATVQAMRALGAHRIVAALGPCIHAECYEFQSPVVDELRQKWGGGVVKLTEQGTPALDLPAIVEQECATAGVTLAHVDPVCTACNDDYYSYRARPTDDRQVMLVWRS